MTPKNLIRVKEHWRIEKEEKARVHYLNDVNDPFTVSFFGVVPDIQADIDNEADLRSFYRRFAESCGVALIEVDVRELDGVKAVRSIVKAKQSTLGDIYVGGYTLPFYDCSIVMRIQCLENPHNLGARQAAVKKRYEGRPDWEEDPYDPTYRGKPMRNQSDDERYDADFPDHPLTRVRRYLADLPKQIDIDPGIKALPPFVYDPSRVPKKPWWKFWV